MCGGVWALAGHRFSILKATRPGDCGNRSPHGLANRPHSTRSGRGRATARARRVSKEASWAGRVAIPGSRVWFPTRQHDPPMDCVMPKTLDLYQVSPRISSGMVPQVLCWPMRTRGPLPSSARHSRRLGDEKRRRGGGSCGVKMKGVFRRVRPVPAPNPLIGGYSAHAGIGW